MKRIAIIGAGNAGCITALELLQNKDCEITIYHNSEEYPIEKVGQGTLPGFPEIIYDVLNIDWYNNPIDATIKTGILYEGWGKKQYKIFHPFAMSNIGSHFIPNKLSKVILKSGLVNVVEKTIHNPEKEIDADVIFDCRGRHNRNKNNYDKLISPVNSVLLSDRYRLKTDHNLIYTRAVATPNGWTFIIPNKDTISYGYLYNNEVTSKDDASNDFIYRFNVPHVKHHMKFESYYAKNIFVGERTVLQGNAYGFIEPLEATAIHFYQGLVDEVRKTFFKCNTCKQQNTHQTNKAVREMMKKNETFILWHYQFGSQYDTPFWEYAKSLPFNPDDTFKYIINNLDGRVKYNGLRSKSFKIWYNGVK